MGETVDFFEVDVCKWNDLRDISSQSLLAVIHCAGLKAVSQSQSALLYYEKNIQGAVNVLRAMDTVNVSKIIFSSSATVYGLVICLMMNPMYCNPQMCMAEQNSLLNK